jgi:hypothetical protein
MGIGRRHDQLGAPVHDLNVIAIIMELRDLADAIDCSADTSKRTKNWGHYIHVEVWCPLRPIILHLDELQDKYRLASCVGD